MTEKRNWTVAGVSPIQGDSDDGYSIRIPDKLFDGDDTILELDASVNWSYEKNTLAVILSNYQLRDPGYEYIATVDFNLSNQEYDCTVPKEFFAGFEGRGSPKVIPERFKKIELPEDGDLVFVYHDGMAEGEVKSCYALTQEQFNRRFSDSDIYSSLDSAPRFS